MTNCRIAPSVYSSRRGPVYRGRPRARLIKLKRPALTGHRAAARDPTARQPARENVGKPSERSAIDPREVYRLRVLDRRPLYPRLCPATALASARAAVDDALGPCRGGPDRGRAVFVRHGSVCGRFTGALGAAQRPPSIRNPLRRASRYRIVRMPSAERLAKLFGAGNRVPRIEFAR